MKCPSCGKEVADFHDTCPYCQVPLSLGDKAISNPINPTSSPVKAGSNFLTIKKTRESIESADRILSFFTVIYVLGLIAYFVFFFILVSKTNFGSAFLAFLPYTISTIFVGIILVFLNKIIASLHLLNR